MLPLGHIQHQRPGGSRMAPNQVVRMSHIRRQWPGGANLVHKTSEVRWCQDGTCGDAKMALAITTFTMSLTGITWHLLSFVSYWHHLAFNVLHAILAPPDILCPSCHIGTTCHLKCCHNFFCCLHLAYRVNILRGTGRPLAKEDVRSL